MHRRPGAHQLLLTMLCILLVIPSTQLHATEFNDLFRYHFKHQEQQLLGSITCADKFNLDVDKMTALGNTRSNPNSIFAEVLCRSHDHIKSNNIQHVVFCEKSRSSWKCPRSELAIRMNDESHALIYFEDDIGIETAYSIVKKLAASKYYQGEDIPKPASSICNIHHHFNDAHALVPDVYAATCGTQQILISTWCPQEECPRIIGKRVLN